MSSILLSVHSFITHTNVPPSDDHIDIIIQSWIYYNGCIKNYDNLIAFIMVYDIYIYIEK